MAIFGIKISDKPNKVTPDDTDKMLLEDNTGSYFSVLISNLKTLFGGTSDAVYDLQAGSVEFTTTDPAPTDTDTGTNGELTRQLFDQTIEEFIRDVIHLKDSISGTVTFKIKGYAVTAAANKNVKFKIYHSAVSSGENWDTAYSSFTTTDFETNSTQDNIDEFTFTKTVAELGWSANEMVRIKCSRIVADTNNLTGDYGYINLRIKVPA